MHDALGLAARHGELQAALPSRRVRLRPVAARDTPIENRLAPDAARISLDEKLPDINAVEWPVAQVGDEDADPLYDSTRDYVVQMDRYKAHQEKPTARQPRKRSALKPIDKSKLTPKQRQYRDWYEKNRDRVRDRVAARKKKNPS